MSPKARLFAEMGFEGLFFARIDHKDKVLDMMRIMIMIIIKIVVTFIVDNQKNVDD